MQQSLFTQSAAQTTPTYVFFDTETTGLPRFWRAPVSDLANWPRLVQIAWLAYDGDGNKQGGNSFIIKPEGFTIPDDAARVHGISTARAFAEGRALSEVLCNFRAQALSAAYLVAHNMSFDEKIIGAELLRSGMENFIETKNKICTMERSTNFCAIPGRDGYK